MKEYPSIPGKIQDITIYAFPKYDGSNVRCEWSKRKGFWKFGSRTVLLDETSALGKHAIALIRQQEATVHEFLKKGGNDCTLFWEFYGSDSFAGNHNFEASDLTVSLIDCAIERQGFVNPKAFIDMFEGYDNVAPCIYHGKPNSQFIKLVKEGTLSGMTFEGVVCKANRERPNCHAPVMFKVKSEAWIKALHKKYEGQPNKIAELL